MPSQLSRRTRNYRLSQRKGGKPRRPRRNKGGLYNGCDQLPKIPPSHTCVDVWVGRVDCEGVGVCVIDPEAVSLADRVWVDVGPCEAVSEGVRPCETVREAVELRVPDDVVDGVRRATLISAVALPNCVIHVTLKPPAASAFAGSGQTALADPLDASVGCIAV